VGEFFAMGGYGTYVWVAYGVTFLGMALLFAWSWFGARSRETELEQVRQWARAERRPPGSSTLRRETDAGDSPSNGDNLQGTNTQASESP
jgi:heme exporter protein D